MTMVNANISSLQGDSQNYHGISTSWPCKRSGCVLRLCCFRPNLLAVHAIIIQPPVGHCDEHADLWVSLSASISPVLHVQSLPIITHATYGHGLVLLWQHCGTLYNSDFMDNITFSHSRPYGGPLILCCSLMHRLTLLLRRIVCVVF